MKKVIKWGLIILVGVSFFVAILGLSKKGDGNKGFEAGTETDVKEPKPKISFSGSVNPSLVKKGDKVTIQFDIENLDDNLTVDGMRILFANENFVKKGLIVVDVMSGGIQEGRAFEWTNDLMKVGPKQKRSFIIVAVANEPGNYESVITFVNPTGKTDFDNQDRELKANLTVLP